MQECSVQVFPQLEKPQEIVEVIFEFIVGEKLEDADFEQLAALIIKLPALPEFFMPDQPTVSHGVPASEINIQLFT